MLQSLNAGSAMAVAGNGQRPSVDGAGKMAAYASAAPAAPVDTGRPPQRAELSNAVADLNKVAQAASQGVRFSIDEETGRTVVKVVDTQTDKVLRQIPTVEALKLWRSIEQMQGVMLRDTA
ncbi:flagellar protein FlaG [Massilia sp. CMS3.1]|uniref:flagellar protein FlaG n=1 Tax=Massilia sp. CMS3.1 TaxID=3373083 RepID=UPI003EE6B2B1